jgi:predicted O-methyltransferase YrrM
MSRDNVRLTRAIEAYIRDVSLREPEILARLRDETSRDEWAIMQISPVQGQFMALLVEMLGARRCLEIGTFTGYSTLVMALSLPDDGQIITCDISETWTAVARRYWAEAGVAHKIDLRVAPAVETLDALLRAGQAGTFDFAFIDADKESNDAYYERALKLVRRHGVIGIDNVLWEGDAANPRTRYKSTRAIQAFNRKLRADERVSLSLLPIGDGLTLACKR